MIGLNNEISNSDDKDTLEINSLLDLAFVLGDVLVTATERERGSEGGVMKQRGSASRRRVLIEVRFELLYLISNNSDERETLEATLVLVLVLVPIAPRDLLASSVFIIKVEKEKRNKGTRRWNSFALVMTVTLFNTKVGRRRLSRHHWDLRLLPSQRKNHGGSPILPILPNGSFDWQKY